MVQNSYRTNSGSIYSIDSENNLLRNDSQVRHNDDVIKYLGILRTKLESPSWTSETIRVCDVTFSKFEDIYQYLPAQIVGVNDRQFRERFNLSKEESLQNFIRLVNPESILPVNVLTTRIIPSYDSR